MECFYLKMVPGVGVCTGHLALVPFQLPQQIASERTVDSNAPPTAAKQDSGRLWCIRVSFNTDKNGLRPRKRHHNLLRIFTEYRASGYERFPTGQVHSADIFDNPSLVLGRHLVLHVRLRKARLRNPNRLGYLSITAWPKWNQLCGASLTENNSDNAVPGERS